MRSLSIGWLRRRREAYPLFQLPPDVIEVTRVDRGFTVSPHAAITTVGSVSRSSL